MLSPERFVHDYMGKAIAFDPSYGVQCVGGFKVWCTEEGVPVIACPNDYAESYWTCKNKSGEVVQSVYAWQSMYFTKITNWRDFKDGDWVVWPRGCKSHPSSHIAMFYQGKEFGQRQYEDYRNFCLKETDFTDSFGALRWKGYEEIISIPYGHSMTTINGHKYEIRRMVGADEIYVLAAGINKTKDFKEQDTENYYNYSKIDGATYFQNDPDNKDGQEYGMTFGDLSAPLNGVYQTLPNQHTTLFYDLETGLFGDCTGVVIDSSHNVWSPSLVWPNSKGHWEFAEMVGLSHKDKKTWYNFLVKFSDGYATCKAQQEMTPEEIKDDFRLTDMINIAFLDGGGSTHAAFWYDGEMHYYGGDDRPSSSCLAIGRKFNQPAEQEDEPMEPVVVPDTTGEAEELQPIQDWKDPEEIKEEPGIIVQRIAALLSVKSLITIFLTVIFGLLVLKGEELPDKFVSIYTMCISFFFGYQFKKAEAKE